MPVSNILQAQDRDWGVAICTCDTPLCNNQAALEFIVDGDVGPMRLLQFIDGSLRDFRSAINNVLVGILP